MKSFRKLLSLTVLFISLQLSGCVVTSDRIYSVCKISEGVTYCYKNDDEFFILSEDGVFAPTSSVGLKALPALHIIPKEGEYSFVENMPGFYTSTLESVNHYIAKLQKELNSTLEVTYCDWNNIEVYIYSDDIDIRLIFNITGQVRIYAVNAEGVGISPPYLEK